MERQRFHRMGMLGILGLIGSLKAAISGGDVAATERLRMAQGFYRGGYGNGHHGWSGKRRKLKRNGITPRRSRHSGAHAKLDLNPRRPDGGIKGERYGKR